MKRIGTATLVATILCCMLCINISATNETRYTFDDANIFTESELYDIEERISKMSDNGATYVIGTTNKYYFDREDLADNFCDIHGLSQKSNLILLIIDVSDSSETHYDVYTYGNAWDKISDAEIDRIIYNENVYDNLKSNAFFSGTMAFLDLSERAYSGHLSMDIGMILLIAVIAGIVVATITCICITVRYKTKLKSVSYPIEKFASLELYDKQDIFLGSSVSRVKVQSSSSSGKSGGGGGGGGHRGGA